MRKACELAMEKLPLAAIDGEQSFLMLLGIGDMAGGIFGIVGGNDVKVEMGGDLGIFERWDSQELRG